MGVETMGAAGRGIETQPEDDDNRAKLFGIKQLSSKGSE